MRKLVIAAALLGAVNLFGQDVAPNRPILQIVRKAQFVQVLTVEEGTLVTYTYRDVPGFAIDIPAVLEAIQPQLEASGVEVKPKDVKSVEITPDSIKLKIETKIKGRQYKGVIILHPDPRAYQMNQ